MATVVDIGTLIVRTPDIRGGRPRIAGTGVTVRRIHRYQILYADRDGALLEMLRYPLIRYAVMVLGTL